MAASLTGCTTLADRNDRAARAIADASVVDQAIVQIEAERELARLLPDMPAMCRQRVEADLRVGMRLDEVALRLNAALRQSEALRVNCARWYDELRASLKG